MEIVGYMLAFIVGVVMGLIGAGGSILSSGLMIYIFGLNPVISASYTLLNVGVISAIGSVQYYRKNLIDLRTALLFSIPAIITVLCMRIFVMPAVPRVLMRYKGIIISKELVVMLVFAALMIVIAWNMMKKPKFSREAVPGRVRNASVVAIGLSVGLLTGIVGVGGGFIIVPALFFFTGLDMKTAVGTSLLIITLNTTVGFVGDYSAGVCYNWFFLIKFIFATVSGMLVSSFFVNKVRTDKIKKLFAIVILCLGCWIIIKELVLDGKLFEKSILQTPSHSSQPRGAFLWYD